MLGIARIAGIQAAKKTSDLIPLCHPLALTRVAVAFALGRRRHVPQVVCTATVETVGPTGVEMEALTAVQVALLTIYDMCKAVDRGMTITGVRVLEKHGGKSGSWLAEVDEATSPTEATGTGQYGPRQPVGESARTVAPSPPEPHSRPLSAPRRRWRRQSSRRWWQRDKSHKSAFRRGRMAGQT